jgi:hypothetical protein
MRAMPASPHTWIVSLALSLAVTPLAACGSSAPESPCTALTACCSSGGLPANLVDSCTAAVSQATAAECASTESSYVALGYCAADTSTSGSETGCSALLTCCMNASFPSADVAGCIELANDATDTECSAALGDYDKAGACSSSFSPVLGTAAGDASTPTSMLRIELDGVTATVTQVSCSSSVSFALPFAGLTGDTVHLEPSVEEPCDYQSAEATVDSETTAGLWAGPITGEVSTGGGTSSTITATLASRVPGKGPITISGEYTCP